jgi:tight adherence protein B
MTFLFTILGIWVAAMAAWFVVSKMFRNADMGKLRSRLVETPAKEKKKSTGAISLLATDDLRNGKVVISVLQRFQLRDRIQTLLEQAGLRWDVARLVHACLGMFLGGYALAYLLLPAEYQRFALLAAALGACLPMLFVLRKRSDRMRKFEEQFPESLEFVARSMRAGHAFSVSLEMIHREFQEPLGGEFRRTFEEHNLGMPLELALEKLGRRVPSLDVHFFVSAVMLQKRTGGNLAEILDKLAYVIRERFKLRGRIRAISAHGKMTGTALTLIPIGVAIMMFWANPDYIRFFFEDEIGHYMMGAAIALQVIGYGVIQKIVNIEV